MRCILVKQNSKDMLGESDFFCADDVMFSVLHNLEYL